MARSAARLVTHRRIKYLVILFWLAVVVAAGPLAGKLTGVEKNDSESWLPNSAESTKVLAVQASVTSPDTVPAVLVYERGSGLTATDRAKATADAAAFRQRTDLGGPVTGPIPSADGQALQTIVPIDLGPNGWERAGTVVDQLRASASAGDPGLAVHITGPAGTAADSSKAFSGIDSTLLYGTIAVVVAILLLTYRSPLLWLLPVASAGIALTSSQAVVYLLAAHAGLTVNAQSAGILTVLVFGAGTDYALLLVARYREELRRHSDRHEAMAVALHRAGPAIVASAATVAIGMLCLLFAEMNSTSGLGPVLAVGIVVGLAAMLTLLPALLVLVGRWIFWPARPRFGSAEPSASGLWARVGERIARRRRATWAVTAAVLAAMAAGVVQLDATGLTNAEALRGHPDSIVGEQVLARHFPAGAGSPVVVVSDPARVQQVRTTLAATEGIVASTVTQPVTAHDHALLQGTLAAPADSTAAQDTVDRVRTAVHAVPGAHAMVGGSTAIQLDVERASGRDGRVIIPIVLLVVLAILVLLLRALLAPVILIATVVLSFGASLGVSALAFRHVFGFGGADASFPLFVFVFLVALGIDYNIFLMTRVREEATTRSTREAAQIGLAATGGVITSAGLVLAGTFSVLSTIPATAFAEVGFAVAFGVLLDTIIVRSILVTALALELGDRIWWPHRLARRSDAELITRQPEPEPEPAGR